MSLRMPTKSKKYQEIKAVTVHEKLFQQKNKWRKIGIIWSFLSFVFIIYVIIIVKIDTSMCRYFYGYSCLQRIYHFYNFLQTIVTLGAAYAIILCGKNEIRASALVTFLCALCDIPHIVIYFLKKDDSDFPLDTDLTGMVYTIIYLCIVQNVNNFNGF